MLWHSATAAGRYSGSDARSIHLELSHQVGLDRGSSACAHGPWHCPPGCPHAQGLYSLDPGAPVKGEQRPQARLLGRETEAPACIRNASGSAGVWRPRCRLPGVAAALPPDRRTCCARARPEPALSTKPTPHARSLRFPTPYKLNRSVSKNLPLASKYSFDLCGTIQVVGRFVFHNLV